MPASTKARMKAAGDAGVPLSAFTRKSIQLPGLRHRHRCALRSIQHPRPATSDPRGDPAAAARTDTAPRSTHHGRLNARSIAASASAENAARICTAFGLKARESIARFGMCSRWSYFQYLTLSRYAFSMWQLAMPPPASEMKRVWSSSGMGFGITRANRHIRVRLQSQDRPGVAQAFVHRVRVDQVFGRVEVYVKLVNVEASYPQLSPSNI
jgi:hypothetical protein